MPQGALLIIDVQNDFCPGGSLAVADGDKVVIPLNKIIEYAKKNGWLIIASRDWHPPITRHFKKYGGLWPEHCMGGADGAKFHPDLKLDDSVVIISKGTQPNEDAYSAFDGRSDRGVTLEDLLNHACISLLYVGGLATDYCVKATVLDARQYEFGIVLLTDACRAVNINPGDGDKAIEEMKQAGAITATTDEVINAANH